MESHEAARTLLEEREAGRRNRRLAHLDPFFRGPRLTIAAMPS